MARNAKKTARRGIQHERPEFSQKPSQKLSQKASRLPRDIALLRGPTEDGEGARLLRLKEGTLFAGEVRPLREGQDISQHEVVRLKPLSNEAPLCAVETLHAPAGSAEHADGPPAARRGGPPRVSNPAYRKNWNTVFGGTKRTRQDWSVN